VQHTFLTVLFSLLLFGMQLEGQRHELQHFGDQLRWWHEQGLQQSASNSPCIECALLAGGSHAIASGVASPPPAIVDSGRVGIRFSSQEVAAPAYYSSRAPPMLP
jgi:hypothetical protein